MKTTDIFTSTVLQPPSNGTENCLEVGTRLADFEITGILGEGGFGIVYLAFDHSLQRTVAIKEYMPGALAGRGRDSAVVVRSERHKETFDVGLKSFINEARFLAQFDHPSLVKVYRYWEQNQTAYTAMRYYDGRTIKDIVHNSPELVTEEWCKFIFKQILEALETLYKMKILHRDVSPDNIIVQPNGDAVLLDFGSARQIIGDMTQGLTVILKPGYAPVEQYASDSTMEQGPWTDIYALSAVMYFAIVKEAPTTSIARMIKDPLLPLGNRAIAKFSERFLSAIDKGLAVQAQDRPQSIDEFRKLLGINALSGGRRPSSTAARKAKEKAAAEAAAKKQSSGVAPTVTQRQPARGGQRRNRGIPMAIGAAVVLLAGAVYVATHSSEVVMVAPANTPLPAPDPQLAAEQRDWNALKNNASATQEQLSAFIQKFPAGKYAEMAAVRLSDLQAQAAAAPAAPVDAPAAAAPAVPVPDVQGEAQAAGEPKATVPAAAVAAPAATEATASYRLVVKPWGTVYLDGQEKGVSPPLKKVMIPPGKHQIRILNPNFPEYSEEIDVGKKKTGSIEHDFLASASAPGK